MKLPEIKRVLAGREVWGNPIFSDSEQKLHPTFVYLQVCFLRVTYLWIRFPTRQCVNTTCATVCTSTCPMSSCVDVQC